MMTNSNSGYTITELCEKYGITKRTVYYYMQIGVLPPATRRGRNHRYSEDFAMKLENALRYRRKVKLAHLINIEQNRNGVMVAAIHLKSDNESFMSYAVDAMINSITKLGLHYTIGLEEKTSNVMFVYPANSNHITELRKVLGSIEQYSKSYNGGVSMSFSMQEKPFDLEVD